jgi:hypothetical protein
MLSNISDSLVIFGAHQVSRLHGMELRVVPDA